MDYQTWTRKANAIDAVKKLLADVSMDYVISNITATNVSVAGHQEWAVTVEIDNPPSDADALQEILGKKARVKALRPEPVPAIEASELGQLAEQTIEIADAMKKAGRAFAKKKRQLFATEGHNPFRPGGTSHAAYEAVAREPGISYAECKARGLRMRAISHALKMGWIKEAE